MIEIFGKLRSSGLALGLLALGACTSAPSQPATPGPTALSTERPEPDPRIGLRAGLTDAGQASWNMRLLSNTPSPEPFAGVTNSDLAFLGDYAIQGNYNGFQIWDISNPSAPTLRKGYFCPASQNDVSVYRNLLIMSSEGSSSRLDCGSGGVPDPVSAERMRGVRIFDISDVDNPVLVASVQTCRGSHTHSLLVDPDDSRNVYVYISGSAGVRSPEELPGCVAEPPEEDPSSALFRLEVIRVPLANPAAAAIVSSPRIFSGLEAPPTHGETAAERREREAAVAAARERGIFVVEIEGREQPISPGFTGALLDSIVEERGGTGTPTAADTAALRAALPGIVATLIGDDDETGPTQCHDITLYPAIDRAGGACEGYGLLLDISDPVNPRRLDAVADSNFSYWHSATFNNDGSKLLFSDEWGGGGGAKCRATDPREWGANAIFTVRNDQLDFQSYYKLPVVQTPVENCVAHNGSMIPIPGRDVMVQGWYQGGISVFDFTDPSNPIEIAFFDRGPANAQEMASGGSWSAYWYNGVIVNSEIARGLDVLELTPSGFLSRNEIDAAKTVQLDYLNVQGQQRFVWPPSFALARAYLDQLERSNGLAAGVIAEAREELADAEGEDDAGEIREELEELAAELDAAAAGARDAGKVRTLIASVRELAAAQR
ncbi:MAG TPA: hypothetical protein VMN78_11850 [Longimicrobiales bacterium]|nr:hypothetical protein [Longimicrobiales bacterium]